MRSFIDDRRCSQLYYNRIALLHAVAHSEEPKDLSEVVGGERWYNVTVTIEMSQTRPLVTPAIRLNPTSRLAMYRSSHK